MGLRISGNGSAAGLRLQNVTRVLSRNLERLSTGKRINSARDDALGLAVSDGLRSQVLGYRRGLQNLIESRGYLQTADSAIATQIEIVQRMNELSVQASNGTLSAEDREFLDLESQQILSEFRRVSASAESNGIRFLDGSFQSRSLPLGGSRPPEIDFQLSNLSAERTFTKDVGTGSMTTAGSFRLSDLIGDIRQLEIADMDHDGLNDAVIAGSAGNSFYFQGRGDGTFNARVTLILANTFQLGDLNNDDAIDFTSFTNGAYRAFINDGEGQFHEVDQISADSNLDALADFNGDGHLDALLKSGSGSALRIEF